MAQVAEFEVLHTVIHGGHSYGRGKVLRLAAADGAKLLRAGAVRLRVESLPVEVEVIDAAGADEASAFFNTIGAKTKAQLLQFAADNYSLTLTGTKEETVSQVLNARARLADPSQATD